MDMTDCCLCKYCDRDKKWNKIRLLEFPLSFVGLSVTKRLDVEADLTTTTYLNTFCDGKLMTFEEARELSPDHRAFTMKLVNEHTLDISFAPSQECIGKMKILNPTNITNRFIFDLRVINVEGVNCCNDESHAEVGRYYVSGQYDYCNLTHYPKIIDFGDIAMKHKVSTYIHIDNQSKLLSVSMTYVKSVGLEVVPRTFSILPKTSKKLEVTACPNSLKIPKKLIFEVRNPYTDTENTQTENVDTNYISYSITILANVYIADVRKAPVVESLHGIYKPDANYTYINGKLEEHNKRVAVANQFLQFAKKSFGKKTIFIEKYCSKQPQCYAEYTKPQNPLKTGIFFCTDFRPILEAPDIFKILYDPINLNFGKVAIKTYGEQTLTIKNNTICDIELKFLKHNSIYYTNKKLCKYTVKLTPNMETTLLVICFGFNLGIYEAAFDYIINDKFRRAHPYKIQIWQPALLLPETNFVFGMTSSEWFVKSLPIKIYNEFNVPVQFEWQEMNTDLPFKALPHKGTVPSYSCRICNLTYDLSITKTKTFELELASVTKCLEEPKVSIIQTQIYNKKVSVKFLPPTLTFTDMPLNLDTEMRVLMENSSREYLIFNVIEPLLPGMTLKPMEGVIKAKELVTFHIKLKIGCILEFSYDLCVRINNKENVSLLILGNVTEPKLSLTPKNIFMPRIPCGLISYVPVTFRNMSNVANTVEVLDVGDEDMFDVCIQEGGEKVKTNYFTVNPASSKTVYVKVFDVIRREYDMYIPFRINSLLGPPNIDEPESIQVGYYIHANEILYEENLRVQVKSMRKDIIYCRILGVFTLDWVKFSDKNFEFQYVPNGSNFFEFSMTNVSRYEIPVTVMKSKLSPNYSLELNTKDLASTESETFIKFNLEIDQTVSFMLHFHPRYIGRFIAVATFYLDKAMAVPYSNMCFVGSRGNTKMTSNTSLIIFPPVPVGTVLSKSFTLTLEDVSDLSSFSCASKPERSVSVELLNCELLPVGNDYHTVITIKVTVCSKVTHGRDLTLVFNHEKGSSCSVEISFCFAACPLTYHVHRIVPPDQNPYPFYPLSTQTELFHYMERSKHFLESWLYVQGFRRELYPRIPCTFHALGRRLVEQSKTKGLTVTILNFIKKIAGPLIKYIHTPSNFEDPHKRVLEIHETYKSIIKLLRSRGARIWLLKAKFLLPYKEFVLYCEIKPPIYPADISFTNTLLESSELYDRLTKQCWFDFILQCYVLFIVESCFFDCVCVSSEPRNVEHILMHWYSEQIKVAHLEYPCIPCQKITNIETDFQEGTGIISAILNHCSFLRQSLSFLIEVKKETRDNDIIHNASIIVEALHTLKLYFPIKTKEFLEPNYLQVLFLYIHLYVILPMLLPKEKIFLNPPLNKASYRKLTITPTSQETTVLNFVIINNNKNGFSVEKLPHEGKSSFVNITYKANFVAKDEAVLLGYGYNKMRIFDVYMSYILIGSVGSLQPLRKCKVSAPIYRPNKVEISISSPFPVSALFTMHISDVEPTIPVTFKKPDNNRFTFMRLNLLDNEIMWLSAEKTTSSHSEAKPQKIHLRLVCFNTRIEYSWIWFRSQVGECFIQVLTQPRWDLAFDNLKVDVDNWPVKPCTCGESCQCYRTFMLKISHRNSLMVSALRSALSESCSEPMMKIFDEMIETATGRKVLQMLLAEGGTKMSELDNVFRSAIRYNVSSRTLQPQRTAVVLHHHTDAVLTLPITIPPNVTQQFFTILFISDDGADIRTYKLHISPTVNTSDTTRTTFSSSI